MGYEIQESGRTRHLRITIHPDGRVVITKPLHISNRAVETFVIKRRAWIDQTLARLKKQETKYGPPLTLPRPRRNSTAYKEARSKTRTLVTERLSNFNKIYNFTYGTISIRDQKTRWGSCSAKGNLSFNYRIGFLPQELADYVIVHELCHTKEHNHSKKFWDLVARTVPNHAKLRKELHRYRH